jgi:hypothetical protein
LLPRVVVWVVAATPSVLCADWSDYMYELNENTRIVIPVRILDSCVFMTVLVQ